MTRRILSFAALAAFLLVSAEPAAAQRAVFVVRHAERAQEGPGNDIPLSRPGAEHAAHLAKILKSAGVTAIYATDTTRARQTAEPLARALKLSIKTYDTRDDRGNMTAVPFVSKLRTDERNGVVLVVGHSNTVPDIIAAYGVTEPVRIGPDEYGDLFLVIPQGTGSPLLLRLRF
jgi:broad specificity phosphatase PhoE